VEALNPVSLKVTPVGVAICAKFEQPAPEQRSTLYPITETLSVEAVHVRLTCVLEAAFAVRFVGVVGGVVSGGGPEEPPQPETSVQYKLKIERSLEPGKLEVAEPSFTLVLSCRGSLVAPQGARAILSKVSSMNLL
jgi:hypothetical protein